MHVCARQQHNFKLFFFKHQLTNVTLQFEQHDRNQVMFVSENGSHVFEEEERPWLKGPRASSYFSGNYIALSLGQFLSVETMQLHVNVIYIHVASILLNRIHRVCTISPSVIKLLSLLCIIETNLQNE